MANPNEHRLRGAAKEAGGKVQKAVGEVTGDERMEAQGRSDEMSGKARKETAKAAGRLKGRAQEVAGRIRQRMNKPS